MSQTAGIAGSGLAGVERNAQTSRYNSEFAVAYSNVLIIMLSSVLCLLLQHLSYQWRCRYLHRRICGMDCRPIVAGVSGQGLQSPLLHKTKQPLQMLRVSGGCLLCTRHVLFVYST